MARVIPLRSDKADKAAKADRGMQNLHRRREAVGIILLALSLFLLLSVASLALGDGKLMGPVGTWVATAVYSVVGVGALLCAYGLLVLAVRCLRSAPLSVRALGLLGLFGAGLSVAMLLHLLLGNYRLHGIPPGGAVGEYGAEMMKALVGTAGTALLCTAGLLVSLLATTQLSFRTVVATLGHAGNSAIGMMIDGVRAVFPTDEEKKEAEAEKKDRVAAGGGDKGVSPRLGEAATRLGPPDRAGSPPNAPPQGGIAAERLRGRRGREAAAEGVPIAFAPAPALAARAPLPLLHSKEPNPTLKDDAGEDQGEDTQEMKGPAIIAPKEPPREPVIAIRPPSGPKERARKKPEPQPAREVPPAREAPAPMAAPAAPRVQAPLTQPAPEADQEEDEAAIGAAPTILDLRDAIPQPIAAKAIPLRDAEPTRIEPTRLDDLDEEDEDEEEQDEDEPAATLPVVVPPPPARPARAVAAAARAAGPVIEAARGGKPAPAPGKGQDRKVEYLKIGTGEFKLPSIDLLDYKEQGQGDLDRQAMLELAQRLEKTLADYLVKGRVSEIHPGPVVTMYEFVPAPGIKLSKITSLSNDLAMALEALKVRIVAPIPGKAAVGIEVPNRGRETVFLKEILADDSFTKAKSKLTLALGKDIAGLPVCVDLAKMPHLLVAGTTGSGKSVSVNGMVSSILFNASPDEVKMIMIDPKMLELSIYEGIPHLLLPVVTDPKKANLALKWAVDEMERRYELISKSGVRDIGGYNKKIERLLEDGPVQFPLRPRFITVPAVGPDGVLRDVQVYPSEEAVLEVGGEVTEEILGEISDAIAEHEAEKEKNGKGEPPRKLPYIVVLIDEFADLMMVASKEVETSVARIAQKARAAGIHLILATQRPSVDVITGLIKANFPSRVAFQVASRIDSRTILDAQGAENLLGMGDMLFTDRGQALRRIHGVLITDAEIHKLVEHLKKQGQPIYDMEILKPRADEEGEEVEEDLSDEMYDQAVRLVAETRQASISMVQRRLRIGYNRAARMIERMEREGIVSAADGTKGREVLIQNL